MGASLPARRVPQDHAVSGTEREVPAAGFTERQAQAWPGAVAQAQVHVPTSTIPTDLFGWLVTWAEEVRPGRGRSFNGLWLDGEYLVQVRMDVYGYPTVSVAQTDWVHTDSDEECPCEPCAAERLREGPNWSAGVEDR